MKTKTHNGSGKVERKLLLRLLGPETEALKKCEEGLGRDATTIIRWAILRFNEACAAAGWRAVNNMGEILSDPDPPAEARDDQVR